MKELNQHIKENIAVHAPKEIPTQKKLVGRVKPHPGQKVYELDLDTRKVTEASFESVEIVHTKLGNGVKKKLVIKQNCMYEVAINQKNAERKFINRFKKLNKKLAAQVSDTTKA